MHWRRKWQPTPVFLPRESQGRGSLVGYVYGVAQSQTQLQRLSSSSSSSSSSRPLYNQMKGTTFPPWNLHRHIKFWIQSQGNSETHMGSSFRTLSSENLLHFEKSLSRSILLLLNTPPVPPGRWAGTSQNAGVKREPQIVANGYWALSRYPAAC